METQIIKKLGSGVMGTVYLVKVDGEDYIYKIEKFKSEAKQLMNAFDRQIDFDETVAQHYPGKFLSLKSYGVIDNCSHRQDPPSWVSGKVLLELKQKNHLKKCYFLIYSPVLDYTLQDLQDEIFANGSKLYKTAFVQILEQIVILQKHGFRHGDIHPGNIMSDGKSFRLIDYGGVSHPKYPKNKMDLDVKKRPSDLVMFLWVMVRNTVAEYSRENSISWPNWNVFFKRCKKHPQTKQWMALIPAKASSADRDDIFTLLVAMNDYHFYKECLGLKDPKFDEFVMVVPNPRMIICCIRNLLNPAKALLCVKTNSRKK